MRAMHRIARLECNDVVATERLEQRAHLARRAAQLAEIARRGDVDHSQRTADRAASPTRHLCNERMSRVVRAENAQRFVIAAIENLFDLHDGEDLVARSEEHTSELQSHSFISYAV